MGGSDQQFHGNRSESSLVCKRDSWIWFSPEMRPSVEDFTSRQRKFKSRDPRVAELAVEISRQEKLNRDIERAAESLIDSSSPSTCKLQDASIRVICLPDKGRCGAIRNRAGRKSRVAPYILPDKYKTLSSPTSLTRSATDDHVRYERNELTDRTSALEISSTYKQTKLAKASPDKHDGKVQGFRTHSPNHRKNSQKNGSQLARNKNYIVSCTESRATPSVSSTNLKHSLREQQNPLVEGSQPHGAYCYNSPAAKVIRQPLISGTYSPLYDNTTLISSTQCSACSMESNLLEPIKSAFSYEKFRFATIESTYENDQRSVQTHKQNFRSGSSSPINLIHSPGVTNLHREGSFGPETRPTSPKRRKHVDQITQSPMLSSDLAENYYPASPSDVPDRTGGKQSPTRRSSRSPGKYSPRKRRLPDRMIPNSNRLTPENRSDCIKTTRRSPQWTCSTGESESESVYRDRSGGPDASYRQCLISKEVNTTVQRLLFDTERSSSSHSPSSRSKIPFAETNTDEELNHVGDREHKTNKNASQLVHRFTDEVNFTRDSPPSLHTDVQGDRREFASEKRNSNEQQRVDISCPPASLNTCPTDSNSSGPKTTHKFTNIYARDYYLGKRVAMKKQRESKVNSNSLRWKKSDRTSSRSLSLRSYSPPNKSKSSGAKREINRFARDAVKRKPWLKPMQCSALQLSKLRNSTTEDCQTRHVRFTECFSKLQMITRKVDEKELNRNESQSPQVNACSTQPTLNRQQCENMKVVSTERPDAFCQTEACAKNISSGKAVSQTASPGVFENHVCSAASTSIKPQSTTRSVTAMHQYKKEQGVRLEPTKHLATGSTNNSSSNVSCSSDKSECSGKQNLSTKTAQFYFVTEAKPNPELTCTENNKFGHLELPQNTHIDMFQNSLKPLKSCMCMKPNCSAVNSDFKSENSSESKDTPLKGYVTNTVKSAYLANSVTGGLSDLILKNFPEVNAHLTADDTPGYNQQSKWLQGQEGVLTVDDSFAHSLEFTPDKMGHSMSHALFNSSKTQEVPKQQPGPSTGEEEKPHTSRCQVEENDYTCKKEESKPAEFGVSQCDSSTPITSSAVKNNSNPDSGYDESLSEKANFDCSFQLSSTLAMDSSNTVSNPQWPTMHTCSVEHCELKCKSLSPCSDVSRSSDLAHRSRVSNECDSEQDTLPSLSDDAFQSSNNLDTLFIRSPNRSCKAIQSALSCAFSMDVMRNEIYEKSPINEIPINSVTGEFSCEDEKSFKKNEAISKWKSQHENCVETLDNTKDKLRPLPDRMDYTPLNTVCTTTRTADCNTALSFLHSLPESKQCKEHVIGTMNMPKETERLLCQNFEIRNAGSATSDSLDVHVPGLSQNLKESFKESTVEKSASVTNYVFPSCDAYAMPLCLNAIKYPSESPTAELSMSLHNTTNTSHTTKSTAVIYPQPTEDIQSCWRGPGSNELLESLISSKMFNFLNATDICPPSRSNTSLTANTPSDWSSLDESNAEETQGDLLFVQEFKTTPNKNYTCTENCQTKETLKPSDSRTSSITSANAEGEHAQCISLPATSSDEEDFEREQCQSKIHKPAQEPKSETNKCTMNSTRMTLISDNGKNEPLTSNKPENVAGRNIKYSKHEEHRSENITNVTKSKVFISSRSMAFSEILKRF